MGELKPNVGNSLEDKFNKLKKESSLPTKMYELIKGLLTEFQFDERRSADVARHILDSNVDTAIEDCVPMKAFFGLSGNSFEEKEENIESLMTALLSQGKNKSSDKPTVAAAKIKSSDIYRKLVKKKNKYARLKKDCRVLEKAMEMRKDLAQTKSSNNRSGLASPYINKA